MQINQPPLATASHNDTNFGPVREPEPGNNPASTLVEPQRPEETKRTNAVAISQPSARPASIDEESAQQSVFNRVLNWGKQIASYGTYGVGGLFGTAAILSYFFLSSTLSYVLGGIGLAFGYIGFQFSRGTNDASDYSINKRPETIMQSVLDDPSLLERTASSGGSVRPLLKKAVMEFGLHNKNMSADQQNLLVGLRGVLKSYETMTSNREDERNALFEAQEILSLLNDLLKSGDEVDIEVQQRQDLHQAPAT